ncbi:hypothetical protein [Alteriqipengyuania sp.]|uniref:hypothetical protein n=1 Tax=Alteriqipengyuania sp. TaxID=2800692 RepID=UPI0035173D20
MKARPALTLFATAAIAASPLAAETSLRGTAPVEGESAIGGSGMWVLAGIVALGIGLAAFTNDDPVSA